MTLREIYKLYLERMGNFLDQASAVEDPVARGELNMQAYDAQNNASDLAHCIAMFGDQDLDGADFPALRQRIEKAPWGAGSPWRQGLNLAQRTSGYPAP